MESQTLEIIRLGAPRKACILMVAIYSELAETAARLAEEIDLPLDIVQGGIHLNGHILARDHEDEYDVIISQAGTANAIKEMVHKPVIAIALTARDYLRAFQKAKTLGKKMVLLSHQGEEQQEFEAMYQAITHDTALSFSYTCREEFDSMLDKVMTFGQDYALIGFGGCVEKYALSIGLPYVLVQSKEKHVREALLAARNITDLNARDAMRSMRLASILNYSREGIVTVDHQSQVTVMNEAAKLMLDLRGQDVLGQRLDSDASPAGLTQLYGDGQPVVNKLIVWGDKKFMVSRAPIHFRSERSETVLTFQGLSYLQKVEARARAQLGAKGLFAKYTFSDIIAVSKPMKEIIAKAKKFSRAQAAVLIEGETGTGKELMAQSIHNESPLRDGPFVAINCAALPESLLESELFGYEEGAFTGAKKGGKPGLFELAHNGTIFLDEIGETSSNIQGRLLRALQEKEVMRVGGDKVINVNVRVVAATNKNMYKMVRDGQFRSDLYYRLNLLTLHLPALRRRQQDIPVLMEHFLAQYTEMCQREPLTASQESLKTLQEHHWPGNVRELENCVGRSVILCDPGQDINEWLLDSVGEQVRHFQEAREDESGEEEDRLTVALGPMKDMQQQLISQLMKRHGGNKTKVAEILGMSRVTLWKNQRDRDNGNA
ncbi:MAG: sigma 54-interacting transcriptional regulator [Candidatus Adiutrix sp.]|jgi:transcriptional regulator with PAS, ATPase and Fis domain|nr:sigma 54-interacting transcriptional regulator [Candidatus Adiutrix sp.]